MWTRRYTHETPWHAELAAQVLCPSLPANIAAIVASYAVQLDLGLAMPGGLLPIMLVHNAVVFAPLRSDIFSWDLRTGRVQVEIPFPLLDQGPAGWFARAWRDAVVFLRTAGSLDLLSCHLMAPDGSCRHLWSLPYQVSYNAFFCLTCDKTETSRGGRGASLFFPERRREWGIVQVDLLTGQEVCRGAFPSEGDDAKLFQCDEHSVITLRDVDGSGICTRWWPHERYASRSLGYDLPLSGVRALSKNGHAHLHYCSYSETWLAQVDQCVYRCGSNGARWNLLGRTPGHMLGGVHSDALTGLVWAYIHCHESENVRFFI